MSGPSSDQIREAIGRWLQEALDAHPRSDETFRMRFSDHLGADPLGLPIVSEQFDPLEHPNLEVALQRYAVGRSVSILGVMAPHKQYSGITLSELIASDGSQYSPRIGPLEYVKLPVGPDSTMRCLQFGALLVDGGDGERLVLFVRGAVEHSPFSRVVLEVMAVQPPRAEAALATIRSLMKSHNVYRGQVLALTRDEYGGLGLRFWSLPRVGREEVILPEPTLEALERHTMGISRHGDALVAAGRSLKRGLLLHGAPGTGKTHSLAYLISQMPDRTVVVLTGQGLGGIGRAFALARALGPAMVVLEDVDLVAMARDLPGQEVNPLLFELLNQMDGLAADTDLVVMLTTNRADLLEPALAARPGRIDQALETPIPDAEARRRLFHLYGTGIDLRLERLDEHVANTEGAVPAFIKELMRRAVLESLMASGNSVVDDSVMERVIADMVSSRDMVVRSLLGAPSGTKPGEPAGASDEPNPLG